MSEILDILTYPNPLLRERSKEIEHIKPNSKELDAFIKRMFKTMYHTHGIGLAAPQVGRLERLVVMDTRPVFTEGQIIEDMELSRYKTDSMTKLEAQITQPFYLINPEILERKGSVVFKEGCLSVPSYFADVKRSQWIRFQHQTLEGETKVCEVDGLLAICVQHEIDHLDGKLFIDHLGSAKGHMIRNKIKKYGYPKKEEPQEGS